MKFTLPPAHLARRALLIALSLTALAFVLFSAVDIESANNLLFSTAVVFAAALLAGLLAGIGDAGQAAGQQEEPKSVFVGNLAFKARPEELRELFSPYGSVRSVRIMTDRATRRPRGFAFVEMDAPAAAKAISALDGREFLGRKLRVSEGSENRRNGNGREAA